MRLVIARCSVDYAGRLSAYLPPAVRLLIVKADDSVLVHADSGGYKPLMWMSPPCTLVEEAGSADGGVWRVTNKAGEQLVISIDEVLSDTGHQLGHDPGLVKEGVEAHLQALLAEHCESMGEGLRLVRREYETGIGPVDLLCRDLDGGSVAVEIKRRGEIDGVEQLTRYLARMTDDPGLPKPVRGLLVAQSITPQARTLAADRGIGCVTVDYDELRGIAPAVPTLF
ncbi:MAG: endonuclease [Frankiaceae bacterium]|nr:endonuclease [Frankiaceae bacterium]